MDLSLVTAEELMNELRDRASANGAFIGVISTKDSAAEAVSNRTGLDAHSCYYVDSYSEEQAYCSLALKLLKALSIKDKVVKYSLSAFASSAGVSTSDATKTAIAACSNDLVDAQGSPVGPVLCGTSLRVSHPAGKASFFLSGTLDGALVVYDMDGTPLIFATHEGKYGVVPNLTDED